MISRQRGIRPTALRQRSRMGFRETMVGLLWCTVACGCLVPATPTYGGNPADAEASAVAFDTGIRPIFAKHCIACHGGVKQAAGLSFVYEDLVLPPNGWIVEPGSPENSPLFERVSSSDPDFRMPPPEHGEQLSQREIDLLEAWIRQGATWKEHWAFLPPQRPELPDVSDESWVLNPIDRFVVARLEAESLSPSPTTSPARWLRRASLALIGLPPMPRDVRSFVNDVAARGEPAYEAAVDRLLASPRFGERWASVWLDQMRYADSKGLGQDGRRTIWKYRDWVIDAFNADLPYDEFARKQLAGDLLEDHELTDLIATACHRLTQTNEEGGTDDEEFRVAAVLDRVTTTWQAWQGVTIGCVQCHSHPYDPIRHEEFYQSVAFFNNTSDSDLGDDSPRLEVPVDKSNYPRARELDDQIEALQNSLWESEYALLDDQARWKPLEDLQASATRNTQVEVEQRDGHYEYHTVDTVANRTEITLAAPVPKELDQLTAIRVTIAPLNPQQAIADSEWGFVISHLKAELIVPGESEPRSIELADVVADEPSPHFQPEGSLNPKTGRGFSAFSRIHYPRQAAFVLAKPIEVPAGARLRVALEHHVVAQGAFALVSKRGHLAVSDSSSWQELRRDESYLRSQKQLRQAERERRKIDSVPLPIMQELPDHLSRPTHVFIRGLFLTKDQRVTPDVPESLPPLPRDLPADRRALAEWLVCDDNPLTARVAVNRFWARLFGIGLVATEEDFGSAGDRPSHPELLDYLALRFQDDLDWSCKQILKEIVLSRTFRQSSVVRTELARRDPDNRLLAVGPRFRLPAEMVRDQALAVSGLLSDKMYGPPVHPPIPEGIWKPFQGSDKWETPPRGNEDRYRRSIYTYVKRSIPYPMFATFDAPSREFCTPRRLRSNTPIQALTTLNDEVFVECSAALADRMLAADDDLDEQLRYGFLLVTCREPNEEELATLEALYDACDSSEGAQPPLQTVASVLLNMDEVVTN